MEEKNVSQNPQSTSSNPENLSNENKEKQKKKLEEFAKIKKGVKDDLNYISNTFSNVNSFEDFYELNKKCEDNDLELDKNFPISTAFILFYIFGFLYSVIQLIAVQEMIIILNAILNELIDELKLSKKKTPRDYNFYEVIKICSFKEIPDIDVALVTSFIGVLFFRSLGFIVTNILFQLIPGILLLFFFFIFLFILESN